MPPTYCGLCTNCNNETDISPYSEGYKYLISKTVSKAYPSLSGRITSRLATEWWSIRLR